ncbi:MAG: cupin domain-containing protein [Dehalococcoidia bacterium]|jgi:hypothetical protein
MAKPEIEYLDTESIPWTPVEGAPGLYEKILSFDPDTGNVTRLVKATPREGISGEVSHPFCEEGFLLKGSFTNTETGQVYGPGAYSCRPAGMKHGKSKADEEIISIEFRYYKL